LYQQQSFCGGQAGSAREAVSTTTMLEFVESGTIALLSELTTLVSTSSSDFSMEFRICTAPRMPAGKTQTQKYVNNVLFSLFPCIKLWGACWLNYLLNSPGLHSVSSRRKELPVWPPWHDYWKRPKARPKWYYWGFQALVFTNPIEKGSSPSTPHSRFLI
jgi:hypothetical protein